MSRKERTFAACAWFAVATVFLMADDRAMATVVGVVGVAWTLIAAWGNDGKA